MKKLGIVFLSAVLLLMGTTPVPAQEKIDVKSNACYVEGKEDQFCYINEDGECECVEVEPLEKEWPGGEM